MSFGRHADGILGCRLRAAGGRVTPSDASPNPSLKNPLKNMKQMMLLGMRIALFVISVFITVGSLNGKNFAGDDTAGPKAPPHIVLIMADDLGWNDVGFHGSNQIPTPNIDALAFNGLILNNYYVEPICTPSRSSLMTGKYPFHTGMQHRVLYGAEPRGLPIRETLLPQHLQRLGYSTHIIGKWHLGSYKKKYTPTFRGFETHFGFWTGHQDYYDHTAVEGEYRGLDMREGMSPVLDKMGQYSTTLFTDRAVQLIMRYNSSKPLFLYLAHAAVHSGNTYDPLPAPEMTVAKFGHISSESRRKFAAMTNEMDTSVGRVVDALERRKMLGNSIVIFTTDNGGPANGFNLNAASNWPLRGTKNTLWEGGVRGVALIWSPEIKLPGRVSMQMMHITDWLPTLYSAAGGDVRDLGDFLDGIDMWDALANNVPSRRTQIVHNIDDIYQISGLRFNQWKIVKGSTYGGEWDGWYGPSGNESGDKYDVGQVLGSAANRAISRVMNTIRPDALREVRKSATVECPSPDAESADCEPLKKPCLFDVVSDPCERRNLADRDPPLMHHMEELISQANKTAVPPGNLPWDQRADPKLWGFIWTNFGDSHPDDFPDV